jgi:TonB family protein
MKTILFGLVGALAVSEGMAQERSSPPADTQPKADKLMLYCSISDQGLSRNCRFYLPITDPIERLKAGTELGYLDAHPFPISGGQAGAEVKVLVRLAVTPSKSGEGFAVFAPEGAFPIASGSEIKDPVWTTSPHGHWTNGFVPDRAARMEQKGEATARCVATEAGTLVNCWIERETPADFGFGNAALLVMQRARMKPVDADGVPVAGRPYVQTFRYEACCKSPGRNGLINPIWAP